MITLDDLICLANYADEKKTEFRYMFFFFLNMIFIFLLFCLSIKNNNTNPTYPLLGVSVFNSIMIIYNLLFFFYYRRRYISKKKKYRELEALIYEERKSCC